MKEQTAKLANECGFDVDKTGTFGNYSEMRRLEKFAELIVKECAELCEGEAIFAGSNGRKDASASNCSTIIRKHFGVEE